MAKHNRSSIHREPVLAVTRRSKVASYSLRAGSGHHRRPWFRHSVTGRL